SGRPFRPGRQKAAAVPARQSMEDLLPFSNETLIRAVSDATTPVVSAIGHEADNPILDEVADLRASTPTDAAKRIVPDVHEENMKILQARAQ
ncbi:exodeoxyribonuclease VII large subunit, partial [Brevibacterium paucivorans]